ncbi:MAG: twin-arginine translocase subunit TatC [Gemmatimonadaceae bacterium]
MMGSPAEMPFLDHLEELRWRIIWSLGALVVGVLIGFALLMKFEGPVLLWLQGPMLPYLHGRRLMNTHPGGGFSIIMQVALIGGIVFALPVILYQVWAFLSPALHRHEKRIAIPVIMGAVFLFVCGVALAWYLVVPMTLRFLTGIGDDAFDQMISANEYFGFVTTLVLTIGAVFELPIVVLLLSSMGLVSPKFLTKYRRHAVAGSFVVAAFITPGDIFVTNLVLTVLLYLLYETSIILSFLVYRKREAKRVADEAQEAVA